MSVSVTLTNGAYRGRVGRGYRVSPRTSTRGSAISPRHEVLIAVSTHRLSLIDRSPLIVSE